MPERMAPQAEMPVRRCPVRSCPPPLGTGWSFAGSEPLPRAGPGGRPMVPITVPCRATSPSVTATVTVMVMVPDVGAAPPGRPCPPPPPVGRSARLRTAGRCPRLVSLGSGHRRRPALIRGDRVDDRSIRRRRTRPTGRFADPDHCRPRRRRRPPADDPVPDRGLRAAGVRRRLSAHRRPERPHDFDGATAPARGRRDRLGGDAVAAGRVVVVGGRFSAAEFARASRIRRASRRSLGRRNGCPLGFREHR